MSAHAKYDTLIAVARALPRLKVAVVHPCDESALKGALEAAELGLIEPILVGPTAKIVAAAASCNVDISRFRSSTRRTARLGRRGRAAGARRQGRGADEGQPPHRRADGRRGQARNGAAHRAAHQPLLRDGRAGPSGRLIITDAAVNIAPTLEDKVDIVQNAIDLGHALRRAGGARGDPVGDGDRQSRRCRRRSRPPRCARWPTAARSPAAILDGPLALDNAIDLEAAKIKKIESPVAGRANVLVVPDLEAGNMLAKSLSFLAGADAAGIVLGARVPIILTSRADSVTDAAGLVRGRGAGGRRRGREAAATRAERP